MATANGDDGVGGDGDGDDGGIGNDGNGIGRKRPRADGDEQPAKPRRPRRNSATARIVKLLLHGEGGSPPYLTPSLLAACLPPPPPLEAWKDEGGEGDAGEDGSRLRLSRHLIFGIEMRDSCVVPVYPPVSGSGSGTGDGGGGDANGEVVVGGDEKPSGIEEGGGKSGVEEKSNGAAAGEGGSPRSGDGRPKRDTAPSGGDGGAGDDEDSSQSTSKNSNDRGKRAERRRRGRGGGGGTTATRGRRVVDPTKPVGFEFGVRRGLAPDAAHRHLGIPPGYETMVVPAFDVVDSYVQSSSLASNKPCAGGRGRSGGRDVPVPRPRCTATEMVLPTPHGHQGLGCPRQFLDCVDGLGATTAVAPCDQQEEEDGASEGTAGGDGGMWGGDKSSSSAGARRVERSVERTAQWLGRLLEEDDGGGAGAAATAEDAGGVAASQRRGTHRPPWLWGAVVGGCSTEARRASARAVAKHAAADDHRRLCGAALVGLHRIHDRRRRAEVTAACLDELDGMGGCGSMLQTAVLATGDGIRGVLDAGLAGVDVIGSDLPARLARRGRALVLDVRGWRGGDGGAGRGGGADRDRGAGDDRAIDGGGVPDRDDSGSEAPSTSPYYIDLNDPVHARDRSPLLDGCGCFSCRSSLRDDPSPSPDDGCDGNNLRGHYTRAYVHHLLNVGELLAEMLLFAHNLHHMLRVFEEMTAAVRGGAGDVELFRRHVEAQLLLPPPGGRDDAGAGSPS